MVHGAMFNEYCIDPRTLVLVYPMKGYGLKEVMFCIMELKLLIILNQLRNVNILQINTKICIIF